MMNKSFLAALAFGLAASTSAFAQTEIQWWHAMTGANNEVVESLSKEFSDSQQAYKACIDLGRGKGVEMAVVPVCTLGHVLRDVVGVGV